MLSFFYQPQSETVGNTTKEGSQIQQRVTVPISKTPMQQKSPATSKSIPLPASSNANSVSGIQAPRPQPQSNLQSSLQAVQKPVTAQQQVSSAPSFSSNVNIQQQPVQQVPHSLAHGVAGPQTTTVAPQSLAVVPIVEVKKETGLDEVVLAQGASTETSHLQTDTKDFLATKEELMDGTMDDKTGEYICQ